MDETGLRRLAEIGVDVYVPRDAARAAEATRPADAMPVRVPAAAADETAARKAAHVLLLADASTGSGNALLAGVARALAFARIPCMHAATADEDALAGARALVAFGEARARAAGAVLSAQRQREIGWVVTADPATLAADARAKRALWSELKRIVRPLR